MLFATYKKPWKLDKWKSAVLLSFTILLITFWYFIFRAIDRQHISNGKVLDYEFKSPEETSRKEVKFSGEKVVHLDLKGAPPRISYYNQLFPLLSQLGATALLIEYEDMFPYTGPLLGTISAYNAYSKNDIKIINQLAEENHLAIIPLVQTFGHLEFILKLKEFKHLREVDEYPQVVCPTHNETLTVIMEMIEQVLQAHPNSKLIHIGADEVFFIGRCDRCLNVLDKLGWSANELFIEHITALVRKIHKNHPQLRILMWDDEFRNMDLKQLKKNDLNTLVEPVVWKYSKEVYDELGPSLWDTYSEVFPKIWIASAFKGATGADQYITDVTHHLQNHRSWMSLVSEYKDRIDFQGILITGWQRYDHFAILCELLPVGLPSLAMSLRLLLGYTDSPLSPPTEVARLLQCEQPYALMGPAFGIPKCSYPGGEILEIVLRLKELRLEFQTILDKSEFKGWMNSYNIENEFSNPYYVELITEPLSTLRVQLVQIYTDMTNALLEVYDNYTMNEWRDTYINPFLKEIDALWESRAKLIIKNHWPKRPLNKKVEF